MGTNNERLGFESDRRHNPIGGRRSREGSLAASRRVTFVSEGVAVRIGIDFETCESHASCMEAAPEVFEVREDGALYILQETPDDVLRPKVEEAARLCPTQSIWIID